MTFDPFVVAMGAPAQNGANPLVQFIPFVLIVAIFYFVILLPMKKKQQKVQAFLSTLKDGDLVVTSGGIYGTITGLKDDTVQIQVADKVRIRVSRNAIVGYQGQEPVAPEGQS